MQVAECWEFHIESYENGRDHETYFAPSVRAPQNQCGRITSHVAPENRVRGEHKWVRSTCDIIHQDETYSNWIRKNRERKMLLEQLWMYDTSFEGKIHEAEKEVKRLKTCYKRAVKERKRGVLHDVDDIKKQQQDAFSRWQALLLDQEKALPPDWWTHWELFYSTTPARTRRAPSLICESNPDQLIKWLRDENWKFAWKRVWDVPHYSGRKSYVLHVPMEEKEQCIVVGDIHGGFHSFFRLLQRWHHYGILNLETLKVKEGYRLVFLGDVLDRGQYSLEILILLCALLRRNIYNQRVIYNRGNHEESQTNEEYFFKELKYKCPGHSDKLWQVCNDIFRSMPSAVVLEWNVNGAPYRVWCSHGGFDMHIDGSLKQHTVLRSQQAMNVRWSDFTGCTHQPPGHQMPTQTGRGDKALTSYHVHHFMEKYNIHYVVRGHQDFYANSWLLETLPVNKTEFDERERVRSTDHLPQMDLFAHGSQVHKQDPYVTVTTGPTTKLAAHRQHYSVQNYNGRAFYAPFVPVLTISTSTDLGRELTKDSFLVLNPFDKHLQHFRPTP